MNEQYLWDLIEDYAEATATLRLMNEIGYGSAVTRAEKQHAIAEANVLRAVFGD